MMRLDFEKQNGLIPCIVQDVDTKKVLMLAYMNEESYKKTIETKLATYYSRSRQSLWVKGETSGHYQHVRAIRIDCDQDTILLEVKQVGAACHTGHYSCFYRDENGDCRIRYVWDQNQFLVTSNSSYGYGLEYSTTEQILAAKRDMSGETHGTHVAGIATGSWDNVYKGIAPKSEIVLI